MTFEFDQKRKNEMAYNFRKELSETFFKIFG